MWLRDPSGRARPRRTNAALKTVRGCRNGRDCTRVKRRGLTDLTASVTHEPRRELTIAVALRTALPDQPRTSCSAIRYHQGIAQSDLDAFPACQDCRAGALASSARSMW